MLMVRDGRPEVRKLCNRLRRDSRGRSWYCARSIGPVGGVTEVERGMAGRSRRLTRIFNALSLEPCYLNIDAVKVDSVMEFLRLIQ